MMRLSVVSLHCSLVNLLHAHFKNHILSNIRAHVTPHTKIIFHLNSLQCTVNRLGNTNERSKYNREKNTLGGRLDKYHTKELIFLDNLSLNTSTNQLISADYVPEVKLKIEIGRKRKNVRESSATKPLSQDFINCLP